MFSQLSVNLCVINCVFLRGRFAFAGVAAFDDHNDCTALYELLSRMVGASSGRRSSTQVVWTRPSGTELVLYILTSKQQWRSVQKGLFRGDFLTQLSTSATQATTFQVWYGGSLTADDISGWTNIEGVTTGQLNSVCCAARPSDIM